MSDEFDFDVVVAGYGPTGQALASLLSRLGHRVCVFEKYPSLYGLPRLCTLDGEAARIIQAAGDVDHAFRVSSWCRRFDLKDEDGELIVSIDWSDQHMCGYPGRISFYQPDAEDAMDAAARERGAEINQGWPITHFVADEDGVTVTARQRMVGDASVNAAPERTVRARCLLGADGDKSTVRQVAGIEREDFGFHDDFLSIDCVRTGEVQAELQRGAAVAVCDPARHLGYVPIGNNRMRFEFGINPDDDLEYMLTPAGGYELLKSGWNLTPAQVEVYRQVVYPFEAKLANHWRSGRVLLAGDAAHTMPPFLGQGACSGLRDSINLAWKLDLVLSGTCDESLLNTYEIERSPHAKALILGSIAVGEVSCERDPVAAEKRNAAYRSGNMPPPTHSPNLADGILRRDTNGDLTPYAGHLIEQGICKVDGHIGRFDDLVGWGFHLIGYEFDPLQFLHDEQRQFLEAIGCKAVMVSNDPAASGLLDLDRTYEAFFSDRESMRCVLVRPDFYIYGAGWTEDDVPRLVDDLRSSMNLNRHAPEGAQARVSAPPSAHDIMMSDGRS